MSKKVTVLTATYNYGRFIEEAVESVLNQRFQDFEYLVIDDGSLDDTQDRMKKYSSRLQYMAQPNGGQDAAFNKALSMARGEYVAFLDADDKWHPDFLQRSVRFLENSTAGMVFCDFSSFGDKGVWRRSFLGGIAALGQVQASEFIFDDCLEQLIQRDFIFPSCTVVRRSVFDQLRFEPMFECAGDYDFFVRVAHHYKVGVIKDPLVSKRDHQNNLSFNVTHSMKNRIVAMQRLLAHPSLEDHLVVLAQKRIAEAYYYWAYDQFNNKNFAGAVKYARMSLKALHSWRAFKTLGCSLFLSAL